jgi:hypothetical protein
LSLPRGTSSYLGTDPACAAAIDTITQDIAYTNNVPSLNFALTWRFVSGSNPAAGCLAEAYQAPPKNAALSPHAKPLAYCLYRFGVLLAANSNAHRYWSNLPTIDTYEQHIVNQLTALPTL